MSSPDSSERLLCHAMDTGPSEGGDRTRDIEFWFEDGSIVLIAQQTMFCVHKSILARSSAVFRDMFAFPSPPHGETLIGECPAVSLSDSASAVRYLLRAIYDGRILLRPDSQLEFVAVAALIRLSHKYQVEDILTISLERLKSCFTNDFEVFSRMAAIGDYSSPTMRVVMSDAVTAVNLARLTDTDSVLPTALYLCGALDTHTLLQGVLCADGGRDSERLSEDDLERCIDGRMRCLRETVEAHFRAYRQTVIQCGTISRCDAGRHLMWDNIVIEATMKGSDIFSRGAKDIETIERMRPHWLTQTLCSECIKIVKLRTRQERRDFWKHLPTFMGLKIPDWDS